MKTLHHGYPFLILTFTVLTVGCATAPYQPYAREVKRTPSVGGIIALHDTHVDEDRIKADTLMHSNCGSKTVDVQEEGEVVTGTQTDAKAKRTNEKENQGGFTLGMFQMGGHDQDAEKTATQATVTSLKEWQIAYRCLAPEVATKPTPPTHGGKKK